MPDNPFGLFSWNTTYGNVTEMIQGGMPGYVNHIYISPTMVQNMPDSTDGNNTTEHNASSEDAEFAAKLAKAGEKTRGIKSMMKEMAKSFEREREQYQIQIDEKEVGKKDLQNQVNIMQELLRYKLKEEESAKNQSYSESPASRVIRVDVEDTKSNKKRLDRLTESIGYEEEKLKILERKIIEKNNSSTDELTNTNADMVMLNDPIAEFYTQLVEDKDTKEPRQAHRRKIKQARERVQKLITSKPRSSQKI